MITIAITKHGQSQYKISSNETDKKGRRVQSKYASHSDPGLAAAEAMNLSRGLESYVILGPAAVTNLIPEKVRSKC